MLTIPVRSKVIALQSLSLICLLACGAPTQPAPPVPSTSTPNSTLATIPTTLPTPLGTPGSNPTQSSYPILSPTITPKPTPPTQEPTATIGPCPPWPLDQEVPEPDLPANYVGQHYRDLPKGLHVQRAWMMLDSEDYALQEVIREDNSHMLWLEKLICRDQSGGPYWEIRAVLTFSLQENEGLAGLCYVDEKLNPEIIAVGVPLDDSWYPPITIRQAWRINRETESFDVLPVEGIECVMGP
jgi:hypothetical protein